MNRLRDQSSPYLLQHADNPVDWQPWDRAALTMAHEQNKPILLSIGYSACHWCHVMAHESFEDAQTAQLMNELFINIKVDREERPDLDRIYQTAHQLLTRNRGGWPLTLFLDPHDQLPFFGGTYFPPRPRSGMPGFSDVLRGISDAYRDHGAQIADYKAQLRDALLKNAGLGPGGEIDAQLVDRACGQLNENYDDEFGGFGAAPKFPHPAGLELLLDAAACTADAETSKRLLYMVDFTLAAMSCGGLHDHLGGGFFRYAVDRQWTIPHFEKMLYDNAPLLSLYTRRAAHTAAPWFAEVAARAAGWMLNEMWLDEGALAASLDADSQGHEGHYYAWTHAQVRAALGVDFDTFAARYGLDGAANFNACWHLRLAAPATVLGSNAACPDADLESARSRLLEARQERERPGRDYKILCSWNAMSARALAEFGQQFARQDCLDAAFGIIDYLRAKHWRNGRLLAASTRGSAHLDAYLDDYALLLDALLLMLSARWRSKDLELAIVLAEVLLAHFEDRENGGFFFTADDHEALIMRGKPFADDALPAGNATAIRALLELGHLLGESRYVAAAERALRVASAAAAQAPSAHSGVMSALLDYSMPPPRVVLRYHPDADLEAWRDCARRQFSIRLRCYAIPVQTPALPGILDQKTIVSGVAVTAYVCSGHECSAPATTLQQFESVHVG